MTDLMKRVAARVKSRTRSTSAEDFLTLTRNGLPKTVFVTLVEMSYGPAAGFASSPEGPFFTEGMMWQPESPAYGLFINFVFVRGVRDVQTEKFLLSEPSQTAQSCCVQPVPDDYPFYVELASGDLHDPKIIISPF